jgi:hypothetical protein
MRKSDPVARIYETYSEEELLNAKDEPDAEIVARFFANGEFRADPYGEIQREFGWDDTH